MTAIKKAPLDKPFAANLVTATCSVLLMDFTILAILVSLILQIFFPDQDSDTIRFFLIRPGITQFSYKLLLLNVARKQGDRDLYRALWISIVIVFLVNLLILELHSSLW